MAIIPLKAWYIEHYEPIEQIIKRPHDLRLNRNSLLKSGLRSDFLNDSLEVEKSVWFPRYLEGEKVEFYIEGSGGYTIANIDLISQEVYFTKQNPVATGSPIIFFSYQREYATGSESLTEILTQVIDNLNEKSRLPLTLELSVRPHDAPMRLNKTGLRKIRKSLLFIADSTPIAHLPGSYQPQLLLDPTVCVEIGYAVSTKDPGQILLLERSRPDLTGQLPFDLPLSQQLKFQASSELAQTLQPVMEILLKRFNLLI